MSTLLHPGVYVREIPSGARSIEGAATSVTIFVGETERGPLEPTLINGPTEYQRLFGGYQRVGTSAGATQRLLVPQAVAGFFGNGGTNAYIVRAADAAAAVSERAINGADVFQASSPGVWGNRIFTTTALSTDGDIARIRVAVFRLPLGQAAAGANNVNLELLEDWDQLSSDVTDENYIVDVLRRSRYIRWHEDTTDVPAAFALIIAGPLDNAVAPFPRAIDLREDAVGVTPLSGSGGDEDWGNVEYTTLLEAQLEQITDASLLLACARRMLPDGPSAFGNDEYVNFQNVFVSYAQNRPMQDLFFIGDLPDLTEAVNPITSATGYITGATTITSTTFNATYWPHVVVPDPIGNGPNPTVTIPPSAYVAGVYARTDGRRGIWKAAAGVEATLGGVVGLGFNVLDIHQDRLNPKGINALRTIPSAGRVVWGARTLQVTSEWRYIPVRLVAMFLRKSIFNGIHWAVFEPNDERLWKALRNTIGAFMETQFRNGAFAGQTSSEAYFVKVDSETTTPDDQAAGVVNIQVGFAPLRPAEFVVVSLQQMTANTP